MRKANEIDADLISDFIFSLIKSNKKIKLSDLFEKYQREFDYFGIDHEELERILNSWIEEKKIFKNSQNEYRVEPTAKDFHGRSLSTLKLAIESKKSNMRDSFFKIFPILLTLVSVIFAILTFVKNKELKVKNIELDNCKLANDSLKKNALILGLKRIPSGVNDSSISSP